MATLAFVFPGQGAQMPGMGKELHDNFTEASRIFELADDIAGYSLSTICFEGPKDRLDMTQYAQPALLVSSVAAFEVLKKQGVLPLLVAGLSLGEYSALVAAESISLEEAIPLVQTRALLMQEAVPPGKGAMAAVMGMESSAVMNICAMESGIVDIANYNCPGQVVISGEKDAVDRVMIDIKEKGGRAIPLAVSVPSHSQLMYPAALTLKSHLEAIRWKKSAVGVVNNVNARENNSASFADLLAKQLYMPVLWEQSVRYMLAKADYIVEVGSGSTLSGLIKKIDKNRLLGQVNDLKSLQNVMEKVSVL